MRIAMISEHASPLAALGGTDAGGYQVSNSTQFRIDWPPVPRVTVTPAKPVHGQPVTFDARPSYDLDGTDIARFDWDLDGNGTFEVIGGDPVVVRTFAAAGTYTVKVRVMDDFGVKTPKAIKVVVA